MITHEFSVSLVLRRDVESLILDFDSLVNATDDNGDPVRGEKDDWTRFTLKARYGQDVQWI